MIYLASSWKNLLFDNLIKFLYQKKFKVYNFKEPKASFNWAEIDTNWESWTQEEYLYQLKTSPKASKGFLQDKTAMNSCSTCVLVLPCGASAHLEAGWFSANKELIIYTPEKCQPELMYLLADAIVTNKHDLLTELRKER